MDEPTGTTPPEQTPPPAPYAPPPPAPPGQAPVPPPPPPAQPSAYTPPPPPAQAPAYTPPPADQVPAYAPPPAQAGYPPAYPQGYPPAKPPMSTGAKYAVTSLVCSIVGVFGSCVPCLNWVLPWAAPIAAIVFGFLGLKSEKRPLALAGIIIGVAWIALMIIASIMVVALGMFQDTVNAFT